MNKTVLAILPISIGGRLTTGSIVDGYRQNGWEVSVYDELTGEGKELINSDYHHIAGYDYSALIIKTDFNLTLPTVNYFSDEIDKRTAGPRRKEFTDKLKEPDCYTFYWDKALTEKEKSKIKNLYYLPHFVNTEVYKDYGTTPCFDVMFAGRLDTDYRLNFFENLAEKLPDLKFAWYAIERHYLDALERAKNPQTIKNCYKGFIDNEKTMAEAINNTKIVFNMNSQGVSSLNYRTFQTAACSRLMISDQREELSLYQGHMPYYEDLADLVTKIRQYLADNELYAKTCTACGDITRSSFNAKDGVGFMIEKLTQDSEY